MTYIDEQGVEWGFRIYKIIGEHWITGARIILHESLYKEILEQYIEYYEKKFPKYKIMIE